MPLEFALRPRFRLDESVAPPRRSRPRLPRVVLPIAGYWLGMAVLTHALIIAAKGGEAAEENESFEVPPAPAFTVEERAAEPEPAPLQAVTWPTPAPEPAPEPSELAAQQS
ncbi:MAG TPA: hypothetical protein VM686_29090, partial [Polyangiaceae bacterium]|nr:hypothetical protein [Polyangiaceae bacterium]